MRLKPKQWSAPQFFFLSKPWSNPDLTQWQTLWAHPPECIQSSEATVFLALRISIAPNWSLPPPWLPYSTFSPTAAWVILSESGIMSLLCSQLSHLPQNKARSPYICQATRDLALRPWPSQCPPLFCPYSCSGARGHSDLCGFAPAVPSCLEALPPDSHLACSLTSFSSLFTYYLTWLEGSFEIVTLISHPPRFIIHFETYPTWHISLLVNSLVAPIRI